MYALLIYADHAATTEVSERALAAAMPFFRTYYGNASSRYALGRQARQAVEDVRQDIAEILGASKEEIVFTSGGSEGNNAVLRGIVARARLEGVRAPHIVVSAIEHPSILATCQALEAEGVCVTYVPASAEGRIAPADVQAALRQDTRLVSIMLANNEVGTVQDVAGIAAVLEGRGVPFHTDAVQAVGHIPIDIRKLGVTYLTASGHKFQEGGSRGGTENTAGIAALGEALRESAELCKEEDVRLRCLCKRTAKEVLSRVDGVRINGSGGAHLPGTLNFGIRGVRGEALVHLLDLKGICVSSASACSAGRDVPSHVLLAMGQNENEAMETLRISYGCQNTEADAQKIADTIVWAVDKIRQVK